MHMVPCSLGLWLHYELATLKQGTYSSIGSLIIHWLLTFQACQCSRLKSIHQIFLRYSIFPLWMLISSRTPCTAYRLSPLSIYLKLESSAVGLQAEAWVMESSLSHSSTCFPCKYAQRCYRYIYVHLRYVGNHRARKVYQPTKPIHRLHLSNSILGVLGDQTDPYSRAD